MSARQSFVHSAVIAPTVKMGSTAAVMAFASPFPEDTAEEIEEATASNLALRPTKAAEMSVASARLEGSKGILDGTATTVEIRREISANARGENSICKMHRGLSAVQMRRQRAKVTDVDVDSKEDGEVGAGDDESGGKN